MSDVSPDTLKTWRANLLAACQPLAAALANVQGLSEDEVWDYQQWLWAGPLTLAHSSAWGREVQVLAGRLEGELAESRPSLPSNQLEESAYDRFVRGVLSTWSELQETGAASFGELGDVLPLVRLLARAHRLVGLAHKRLNVGAPCHQGPTRVGASHILPVISGLVLDMTVATSHLAQPCHTGAAGGWRRQVAAEIRDEMEHQYRDRLESTARELEVLQEAFRETVDLGVQHLLEEAVPGAVMAASLTSVPPHPAVGGPAGVVTSNGGESASEGPVTPPSPPTRLLPVGGPAGMFSPPGKLEEEEEQGGAAPTGGLARTPVLTRRAVPDGLSGKTTKTKMRREAEARQEAAAMAASDLFGPQPSAATGELEHDRIRSLEAQVAALTQSVSSLLELAKGAGIKVEMPSPVPQPPSAQSNLAAAPVTSDVPDLEAEQPSPADEVTALKLRQDRRKEKQAVLKVLLPWAKHLAVLFDRTSILRPALHRLYGPPTYHHIGEVAALEDAVKMYRAMAYPSSARDASGPPLTFRFHAAVAVALVHFRVGGPLRDSEPLYLRTLDLVPLAEGEERRLAYVDESMFSTEPVWTERRPPLTITAFRDCGLRMAYFLGLHWGPRCRHELTATVEALHDKGMRSPTVMTPAMAGHLLDLLILTVTEAVYDEARGRTPLPVGTDALTPSQLELYRVKGWSTDGPTFRASLQSEFMQRWWHEPLQEAALSDPSRRTTAMRLMGMDHLPTKPPKGGPTGGSLDDQPPAPAPRQRANFTVEEAAAAAASLPGTRHPAEQVCMRYLSAKGCQRGSKCRFTHLSVTAGQLRECARANPHLQKILTFFGGPSTRNLGSQVTQASSSAPQAGRSGGLGDAPDSDDASDEDLPGPLARGGKASGGTEVQVPYLLALGDFYPRAPRDDARSVAPCHSLQRPSTVHPDAPCRPFSGAIDLVGVSTPALTSPRAGSLPVVVVSPTRADGSFTVWLGDLTFHGQDAGQELVVGTTTVTNACVVLSFASVLRLSAADLFSHLVIEAQAAALALGSPACVETATALLLRAFCHDILASWARGHPLDALIFLYFPHPALLRAVVVVVHTQGSSVAIDVLRGPAADASSPLLGCLQRRGTPGHMQPLSLPPFTLPALEAWAAVHGISVRLLDVQPWQAWLATDPSGPSVAWMEHRLCDFCASPRFPLPPVTL